MDQLDLVRIKNFTCERHYFENGKTIYILWENT